MVADTRVADVPGAERASDRGPADRTVSDGPRDLGPLPDACGGSRTLSPTTVAPYAAKPCGTGCKQVTFGNFVEKDYEVAGNLLAYVGSPPNGAFKVYFVDLTTGTERMLENYQGSLQGCSLVSTDGQKLAYTCVRAGLFGPWPEWDRSLTLLDPQTNLETDVHCVRVNLAAGACFPTYIALGTTGIVLNGTLGTCSQFDALFYRFPNGTFSNVSQKQGGVWHTHMSGPRVVWTEASAVWQAAQVVLYDTQSGARTRVAAHDGADQYLPRIEGSQIVWTDHRNGPGGMLSPANADIYHHDLSNSTTTRVTTDPGTQERPDVWGDWVAWQDWRDSPGGLSQGGQAANSDVYAKNLKTGQEVQLTSFAGHEAYVRVDNGRVFFRMLDAKNRASVFMIDLKTRLGL